MSDLMTTSMDSHELSRTSPAMRSYSLRRSLAHSPSSLDVSQLPTYALESSMKRKNYLHRRSRSYDTSIPDLTSLKLYKSEKKKSFESLLEYDFTAAVFEAVKEDDLKELATILDGRSGAINDMNADGMSVLDVALLSNCTSIANYLLQNSANTHLLGQTGDPAIVISTLEELICECEQAIATLSGTIMALSSKHKVREKKLNVWLNKRKILKNMKTVFSKTDLPPRPTNIKLTITSQTSLRITFDAPQLDLRLQGSTPIIGYKAEWSCCSTFPVELTEGTYLPAKDSHIQHDIIGLLSSVPYHIRISSHNMKGFGENCSSEPKSAIPSSWCQCPGLTARPKDYNSQRVLELYYDVKSYRLLDDSSSTSSGADVSPSKPSTIRKGLRGLFTSQSAKFAKSIKRGIYLACVFSHEERILVTEEDKYLPIIEVDDTYNPVSIAADFSWLFKVSCHWDDLRQLKEDMERLTSVTSYSLRNQLLNSAIQLQMLLGVVDLGLLHYTPIKDPTTGAIVFPLVNKIADPRYLTGLQNVKWCPLLKLHKTTPAGDCLIPLLSDVMLYRQVCINPLPAGLYLGYLQTEVTNGSITICASQLNPNSLPLIRIRDNCYVSMAEWKSLLELSSPNINTRECEHTSKHILRFHSELARASRRLMESLDIPTGLMVEHRLYDCEVLEFSPSVSMIVLLPPREQICSILSTDPSSPSKTSANYLTIPVKRFEISHLYTYQEQFIKSYTRAMVLIDMEYTAAQQTHREAFTNREIVESKQQVEDLRMFQSSLEDMWSRARWVTDIITIAREKDYTGTPMRLLYQSVINKHGRYCREDQTVDSGYYSNRQSMTDSVLSPSNSGVNNECTTAQHP